MMHMTTQAEIFKNIELDPDNILEKDNLELTLNDQNENAIVVQQNGTIYIDTSFFQKNFSNYDEVIKNNPLYGGTFKDASGKEVVCLPAFLSLEALKVRYTFSNLYGKVIIRIRTDNDFKVNPNYFL